MEKENRRFIRLARDNHCLLRIKLNEVPEKYNARKGEVDIMIETAKRTFFDVACVQTVNGRIASRSPVNNVSWHGFYDEMENHVKLPVINFKDQHNNKIWYWRHTGVVKQDDIFLFPICSIYVPRNIELSNFPVILKANFNDYILNFDSRTNVRVDFFVLPKGISVEEFASNFAISLFYFIADITIFNRQLNGALMELPVSSGKDVEFHSTKIGEWHVLMRLLYTEKTREPELDGKYCILFHDPNDAIEMLLERLIGYPEPDGTVKLSGLRERHEMDLKAWGFPKPRT